MRIQITTKYSDICEYTDYYTHDTTIHCPSCGNKSVYVSDEADYYQGSQHLCIECTTEFRMPLLEKADKSAQQAIKKIKEAIEENRPAPATQ